MKKLNVEELIPHEGFIKISKQRVETLSSSDRVALIRRGNEFFNNQEYEKAKRVFLTTGYSDGIIRLGEYYLKNDNIFEAYRMFWLAPAPEKVEELSEQFAQVIKKWINE